MPAERIAMRQVRDVLRLKAAGVSGNEIARRVGVAPSTVRLTLKRLAVAGLTWPLPAGIDPQTWLADVLRRITDHPVSRLDQLLLRRWKSAINQSSHELNSPPHGQSDLTRRPKEAM